ncbi:MAG: hypothetical protein ACAI44_06990 [Candidatus Sericytochromatia bacterium]
MGQQGLENIREFAQGKRRGTDNQTVAGWYAALSESECRQWAETLLADAPPNEDQLLYLACLSAFGFKGLHEQLFSRQIFYPALLYQGADTQTRDRILELLLQSDPPQPDNLLKALAWIGDEGVQQQFQAWRLQAPVWRTQLYVGPEAYAPEAGWELTPGGERRNLVSALAYALLPAASPDDSPVRVALPREDTCNWCRRGLIDLFSLDLTDVRLAIPGWPGNTLKIVTCQVCTCFAPVFMQVDANGQGHWHPKAQSVPADLPEDVLAGGDGWQQIPADRLQLAESPRAPLSAAHEFTLSRTSGLGGYPAWVQDAAYPACPDCGHQMPFVAQLKMDEVEEYAEGVYYAFACSDCRVTATAYQQT